MAADPLDSLRLTLMQDVLPMGLAAVERMRKGGPQGLIAAFDGSTPDPLAQLRQEGEPAATQLREQLDRVSPGLGNPVMKVEVRDVNPEPAADPPPVTDPAELQRRLAAVAERLRLLEQRLADGAESH
jgi:glutathione S-transferase